MSGAGIAYPVVRRKRTDRGDKGEESNEEQGCQRQHAARHGSGTLQWIN